MPRFIRVDTDLPDHPKTLRFIRLCANPLAPFALIRLWLWAADRRPDGDLFQMDADDIERAAGWTGMAGKFYLAAVECSFLDGESSRHTLHNWSEYQGYFQRESSRKAHGRRKSSRAESARTARKARAHRIEEDRIGDQIIDQNLPTPTPSASWIEHRAVAFGGKPPIRGAEQSPDSFLAFWALYPKRVGKGAALKAWKQIRPSSGAAAFILAAVAAQKSWPAWTKDGGRYIPNPATWLNQTRWEDEAPEVPKVGALSDKWDKLMGVKWPPERQSK